ncbi:hypothetical protein [Actinoplanes regularis]|uniref:hypothetical protein n=1 Tax=Actinoplanes regularis TaxID=52697 RepID=UPI002554E818|nr:hypothetical protein [Actinoplanes regularis]
MQQPGQLDRVRSFHTERRGTGMPGPASGDGPAGRAGHGHATRSDTAASSAAALRGRYATLRY